jgi:hypothetical protein
MRRLAIAAGAIAALALAVPALGEAPGAAGPAVAAANGGGCEPRGSRTIVRSRSARVYRLRQNVYGCLLSRGVPVLLTETGEFDEVRLAAPRPRLFGRFVAYAYVWDGGVAGGAGVAAADLRSGRIHGVETDPSEEEPDFSVTDLVVTRGGTLVWIWRAEFPGEAADRLEVRRLGPRERRRLGSRLDAGPELDLDSLEVRGSAVSWVNAGERRSATLR